MEQFFQHGLSNAAMAALLAIAAAIATRIWRNPYFAYAIWLIVLVRLIAPPLVPVSVPIGEAGAKLVSRAVGLIPTDSGADQQANLRTVSTAQSVRGTGSIARPNESEPRRSADGLARPPRSK